MEMSAGARKNGLPLSLDYKDYRKQWHYLNNNASIASIRLGLVIILGSMHLIKLFNINQEKNAKILFEVISHVILIALKKYEFIYTPWFDETYL